MLHVISSVIRFFFCLPHVGFITPIQTEECHQKVDLFIIFDSHSETHMELCIIRKVDSGSKIIKTKKNYKYIY